MIVVAILCADRKAYSQLIALNGIQGQKYDKLYVNVQTENTDLFLPMMTRVGELGADYDLWSYRSSFRRSPEFDQDQARLSPICIARNMAVDYAMGQDASHLVFVDSDVLPHAGGFEFLQSLNWPLVGGVVPGRGEHSGARYIFGIHDQTETYISCEHGTLGYSMISRDLFEFVRFRYGRHPTVRNAPPLSEDPAFAADVKAYGLCSEWRIHKKATADHYDNPEKPLTIEGAVNDYHVIG